MVHAWGEVTNALFFQFCPLLDQWNDLFLLGEAVFVCYIQAVRFLDRCGIQLADVILKWPQ